MAQALIVMVVGAAVAASEPILEPVGAVAFLAMVPVLIVFLVVFFLPESPRWLARKDRWDNIVLGSMADMPKDLKEQIDKLEDMFVVPTDKLKKISDHFVGELEKDLFAFRVLEAIGGFASVRNLLAVAA